MRTGSGNYVAHELIIETLYDLQDHLTLFLEHFDDAGEGDADDGGGEVCTCYHDHAELLVEDAQALAYMAQHFLSCFEGSAFSFPAMRERHGRTDPEEDSAVVCHVFQAPELVEGGKP